MATMERTLLGVVPEQRKLGLGPLPMQVIVQGWDKELDMERAPGLEP